MVNDSCCALAEKKSTRKKNSGLPRAGYIGRENGSSSVHKRVCGLCYRKSYRKYSALQYSVEYILSSTFLLSRKYSRIEKSKKSVDMGVKMIRKFEEYLTC